MAYEEEIKQIAGIITIIFISCILIFTVIIVVQKTTTATATEFTTTDINQTFTAGYTTLDNPYCTRIVSVQVP